MYMYLCILFKKNDKIGKHQEFSKLKLKFYCNIYTKDNKP